MAKRRSQRQRQKPAAAAPDPADVITDPLPSTLVSRSFGAIANGQTDNTDVVPQVVPRPARSQNREYDQVEVTPSSCKKCRSTKRTSYFGQPQVRRFEIVHRRPGGFEFTRLIRRRTKCETCGQFRFDLSYEFHPEDVTKVATRSEVPAFLGAANE